MKAFLERVNAALPTNHPDAVLLTLVRGHSEKACGTLCPAGQGRADSGRCVPTTLLREANRTAPATTGWLATATVAPSLPLEGQTPLEGQMSLAGPKTEINSSVPKAKPAQPERRQSPIVRQNVDRSWIADLWKKQGN